jgi:receptor protein-tyrosine kinase
MPWVESPTKAIDCERRIRPVEPMPVQSVAVDAARAQDQAFELRDYLGILRRRWRSAGAVMVLVMAAVLVYSISREPVYEATTEVLLKRSTTQIIGAPGAGEVNSTQGLATELAVLTSRSVRDAVREELGHAVDVDAQAVPTTDVIRISARSSDADQAISDANGYATISIEVRRDRAVTDYLQAAEVVQAKLDELAGQINTALTPEEQQRLISQRDFYLNELDQIRFAAGASEIGGAQVVSEAITADKVRPAPLRDGLVGLIAGLLLGMAFAFLREYLDDSIRGKADLERASGGLTVLGLIPAVPGWKEKAAPRLVSLANPRSIYTEAYVSLRTSLQFLSLDRPLQIIQLTSPGAGEGKTTTAANLGVVLARAGTRVVIVSCDLRVPRLHAFFGQTNDVGFTSVLLGQTPLSAAIQPVPGQPGLVVLPSGPPPPNPAELLSSPRATEVLRSIATNCDIVLVDSPPTLPVADAAVLSRAVDATIVVARAGKTNRRSIQRAVEILRQVGAPLVGTVLNDLRQNHGDTYALAYGYGYGYVDKRLEAEPPPAAPGPNGTGDATLPDVPLIAYPPPGVPTVGPEPPAPSPSD